MRLSHLLAAAFSLGAATLSFAQYEGTGDLKIARPEDKQDVQSTPAPEGAKVLFDGKNLDQWQKKGGGAAQFEIKEGGAMQVKGGDIHTKETFAGPFKLHVEFRTPYMPGAAGQGRGNSGVYVQGRYEVQVLDSYGIPKEKYGMNDCGSIYGVALPAQIAVKAPTAWQSYDIEFHPPVFEGDKKAKNARMTVFHNGVKIHDNVEIKTDNTASGMGGDPKTPGPILLQDHGNPVQFRNVWIQEMK